MATVKLASGAKWDMAPLPALDAASLVPKLDVGGMAGAITTLWEAFGAQQQLCSELAASLQEHKTASEKEMAGMKDHMYGLMNDLRDDLAKTKEENRELNNALKDLMKASERETRAQIDEVNKELAGRVGEVQQQATHAAHVANTALERALDAKTLSDENAARINDVEDVLSQDLNRLMRTLGLTKGDCRRACDNEAELETMLKTPALAHILGLLGDSSNKDANAMSPEDLKLLSDLRARLERTEAHVAELAPELRGADRNLGTRIDRLESQVRGMGDVTPVPLPSGDLSKDQADALNTALSRLRSDVAQLRGGLDALAREVGKKADAELADRLADGQSALAARVAALEGTLNDTRGNVDEALRMARQALRNSQSQQQNSSSPNSPQRPAGGGASAADAHAIMMLRDSLDALGGRVAGVERDVTELDTRKAAHDELNKALQDVLKAMEQAIAQLYGELKRQLGAANLGPQSPADDEPGTSGRFRCLSCNRRAGPLQEQYHERVSKRLLPPGETLTGGPGSPGGISPPRTSPPRAPAIPGTRDGFEPRPLTGSRRKLQSYYDWLQTKSPVGGQQESGLGVGLVGKQFTSRQPTPPHLQQQPQQPQQRETSPTPTPTPIAQQQQQQNDVLMNSARVANAEMPPARTESPNPATTVGFDGRHYLGVQARNAASQLKPQPRPTSPRQPGSASSVMTGVAAVSAAGGSGSRPQTATRRL